ncbi:MAG TPA: mycofactocin-coupled SDR family oxidoreductase [Acidimicrobiales bacterium]|nr:mycofactocin-coupled SDR family oxidoreductase [Acidimicrobiales bacterium]
MARLEGKVAFITGAARGQGRCHAVRLASDGADIIAVDICQNIPSNKYELATPADLKETVRLVESQGRQIIAEPADVRDYTQLLTILDKAVAQLGRLDIVIANAGIAPMSFDDDARLGEEAFRDVIDVNLVGAWNTCRVSIPHLVAGGRGGAMVLTSSTAGIKGYSGSTAGAVGYTAAKHGVVGIMRTLANDLAPHNIRVNTIHPTGVNTMMAVNPVMQQWIQEDPSRGEHMNNPMPVEVLEPEDITNAVAFLVSDEARYITGVMLPVDAGFCNK